MRVPRVRFSRAFIVVMSVTILVPFLVYTTYLSQPEFSDSDLYSPLEPSTQSFGFDHLRMLLEQTEKITGHSFGQKDADPSVRLAATLVGMSYRLKKVETELYEQKIETLNQEKYSTTMPMKNSIFDPSLLSIAPHLNLKDRFSLDPRFRIVSSKPQNRSIEFIFGIPTVIRPKQSYLEPTLQNLFENLTPAEKAISLFIVFIGETNDTAVQSVIQNLTSAFPQEIDSGLLEIISPPAEWYPDMGQLRKTLNDKPERVQWRSKQNLDFAYLWLYARSRMGTFYVQLEDDIIARRSYVTQMTNFIARKTATYPDWICFDFCALGFIGKLFKVSDLLGFVIQFLLFFNDKPVDWLLADYFRTKFCSLDQDTKACHRVINKSWIPMKPSLFQHVGTFSSLNGKVQKLKDKTFAKGKILFKNHVNPEAEVRTSLEIYQMHRLSDMYKGTNFFWALSPKLNDTIEIILSKPTVIHTIRIVSGNDIHPGDIFPPNTVVELRNTKESPAYSEVPDAVVTGLINVQLNTDKNIPEKSYNELRIRFQENAQHWLLISEIQIS